MPRLTLREFKAELEKVKGMPVSAEYVRRMEKQYNEAEARWKQRMRERYEQATTRVRRNVEGMAEDLPFLVQWPTQVVADLEAGRITVEDAKRQIFDIKGILESVRDRIDVAACADDEAWVMATSDPADDFDRFASHTNPGLAERARINVQLDHVKE